jgi:hypothetical protein
MSVLNALDATRICTRWSPPLADPAAWRMPAPNVARRQPAPALMQQGRYSWWSVVRNPHAMLVTGVVGTVLAKDAMLRILAPAPGAWRRATRNNRIPLGFPDLSPDRDHAPAIGHGRGDRVELTALLLRNGEVAITACAQS